MPDRRLVKNRDTAATRVAAVTVPQLEAPEIGARVRQLRIAREWTGDDLVAATGIPRSSLGAIEAGYYVPGITKLLALSMALHCSIEFLLLGEAGETDPASATAPASEHVE